MLQTKNYLYCLVSFFSGIILAFSMPGYELGFVAWIGFVPYFLTVSKCESVLYALISSFAFGLGFNLTALKWFLGLHPLNWMGISDMQSLILSYTVWVGISLYISFFYILFGYGIFKTLKSQLKDIFKILIISSLYVIIVNKLTSCGIFAFPWSLIEYSQYKNIFLMQIVQFIKGTGLEFIILTVNALLALILVNSQKEKNNRKILVAKLCTVFGTVLILNIAGYALLKQDSRDFKELNVTILQTNNNIENQKTDIQTANFKQFFLNRLQQASSGIIISPEGAIVDVIRYFDHGFCNKLFNIAKNENKTLVVGTFDKRYIFETPFLTNSAFTFDKNMTNSYKYIYDKEYLVPFGEYTPFRDNLPDFIKKIVDKASAANFIKGENIKVIPTQFGKIAPSICYEIIFPDLIKNQVKNGADILVNLSNLSWFHDTIIKDQFLSFAVLRSAEVRKPFILSVNTGYSAVIGYNARILKILPKNSAKIELIKLKVEKN